MAASRAVWQRAAKRAPKLSCCPSISSVISKVATRPLNPADLQPDYMYQENQDECSINSINSMSSKESFEFVQMDSVELPWWQVAETNYLGSFESKKSHNLIENSCRTNILEALCHSQTRAREAECAAKKAYAEKEHAIKVVFRQALELFAYRQWIYVLQLENLCYQMEKNKSDSVSAVCAFSRSSVGKFDENLKKGKRTRIVGRYEHDLGGYAVVFVVGLGIVGAGLLLGWTVGWMLI